MVIVEVKFEVETFDGWKCEDCEAETEDEPASPLYECGTCGMTFTRDGSADGESHRCPGCLKFAAKLADYGCPECGDGEMVKVELLRCPGCNETFESEDELTEHLNNALHSH